ncbi:MAG: hypothetical protein HC925_00855 [Coleofasciculaceae cyanobacterium SM2_3_26]|nr:hypothetical protein [Coleofasciculaceae cyanobacterium SM2_3_26]
MKRRSLLTHPPSFPPQNAPSTPPPISDGLTEVHRLLHQGAYAAALQTANALLEQYPPDANLHGRSPRHMPTWGNTIGLKHTAISPCN